MKISEVSNEILNKRVSCKYKNKSVIGKVVNINAQNCITISIGELGSKKQILFKTGKILPNEGSLQCVQLITTSIKEELTEFVKDFNILLDPSYKCKFIRNYADTAESFDGSLIEYEGIVISIPLNKFKANRLLLYKDICDDRFYSLKLLSEWMDRKENKLISNTKFSLYCKGEESILKFLKEELNIFRTNL